ncbi:hypothetical protein N008_03735 [Hymenobacter sp. APR13]|nr:hypothetical protein N008_03735 [Hymenobacter sp. APR13]
MLSFTRNRSSEHGKSYLQFADNKIGTVASHFSVGVSYLSVMLIVSLFISFHLPLYVLFALYFISIFFLEPL